MGDGDWDVVRVNGHRGDVDIARVDFSASAGEVWCGIAVSEDGWDVIVPAGAFVKEPSKSVEGHDVFCTRESAPRASLQSIPIYDMCAILSHEVRKGGYAQLEEGLEEAARYVSRVGCVVGV